MTNLRREKNRVNLNFVHETRKNKQRKRARERERESERERVREGD